MFGGRGSFNPIYDEMDFNILEAETLIVAIGQAGDLSCTGKKGTKISREGGLEASHVILETNFAGVFASGDVVTGPASITEAIADEGKRLLFIDRYLSGTGRMEERLAPLEKKTIIFKHLLSLGHGAMEPLLFYYKRLGNLAEVKLCFS